MLVTPHSSSQQIATFCHASCCAQAPVQVLVDKEAAADVYNMRPDDMVSVGPFEGTGLDLRSSGVLGVFRWAAAAALVLRMGARPCCARNTAPS